MSRPRGRPTGSVSAPDRRATRLLRPPSRCPCSVARGLILVREGKQDQRTREAEGDDPGEDTADRVPRRTASSPHHDALGSGDTMAGNGPVRPAEVKEQPVVAARQLSQWATVAAEHHHTIRRPARQGATTEPSGFPPLPSAGEGRKWLDCRARPGRALDSRDALLRGRQLAQRSDDRDADERDNAPRGRVRNNGTSASSAFGRASRGRSPIFVRCSNRPTDGEAARRVHIGRI